MVVTVMVFIIVVVVMVVAVVVVVTVIIVVAVVIIVAVAAAAVERYVMSFSYSGYLLLWAQERPATLILTVTSGLHLTHAHHVYSKDAETRN